MSILLMFIGASPASTGGGIKPTTFVVLAATVISLIRGHEDTIILKRRIDKSVVYRALAIVTVAMLVVVFSTSVILLSSEDQIGAIDALFESVSAFGTVGLTTGITQILSPISKICLCLTKMCIRDSFASVNVGAEHDITKVMSILLMFIGASPASTGGGIKTTTFVAVSYTHLDVYKRQGL